MEEKKNQYYENSIFCQSKIIMNNFIIIFKSYCRSYGYVLIVNFKEMSPIFFELTKRIETTILIYVHVVNCPYIIHLIPIPLSLDSAIKLDINVVISRQ